MEALLHYCWKHHILPLGELKTTDGRTVEVIDPGLLNRDAGPDFFNAKVRIDGEMWVGNIELHIKSRDWYAHHHDTNAAYDNVVLHVVEESDGTPVRTSSGMLLPELVIAVPDNIRENYRELLSVDSYPPCYKVIPSLSNLKVHAWMAALQTERLQQKTDAIEQRLRLLNGDWEHAYFVTLARSYGFGSNSDALEQWASTMDLHAAAHHRDDLLQVEALFLGMAGLIRDDQRMQQEYDYLSHKFGLNRDASKTLQWKFMRMRPQNFPNTRIRQLALLFHENRTSLSQLLECDSTDAMRRLFGKRLSAASINVLMINCLIPMLFAYGRQTGKEQLCERAFDLLEDLKPENNNITRMWKDVGLDVRSAGDSQALIQLKKCYCDPKDCLRCRFGFEYLSRR